MERAVVAPPRKSGGGGLRVLFFCIVLVLLLKSLAWRASKPSRPIYTPPSATPRYERTEPSWRYENGARGRRTRSVEHEVIGQSAPAERRDEPEAADAVEDRPPH